MKNTKYLKYQENKITKEKQERKRNTKYLKYEENKITKEKLNSESRKKNKYKISKIPRK